MIKRATVSTWAEYFEKREGVKISDHTIRNRLKEAGKIGETARSRVGRLLRNAYFTEIDVRQACADLLLPMPQADDSGFFVMGGIRYGTFKAWSRGLGLSYITIASRLRSVSASSAKGRGSGGQIRDFYPEPAVTQACAGLIRELPRANEGGFFNLGGIRHGTAFAWSRELGVTARTISAHLRSALVLPIEGKMGGGQIQGFFSEPAVTQACADLIRELPRANEGGFFELSGIRHGTISSWARELRISENAILSRLQCSSVASVEGKGAGGNLQGFFSEPAVRSACADLLMKKNK